MLRDTGVEGVGGKVFLAAKKPEPRFWHDQVEVCGHGADGAVAKLNLEFGGGLDLETDPAAVASAAVNRHSSAVSVPSR